MSNLIVLFESAVGYSLFKIKQWDEIQGNTEAFIKSVIKDFGSLSEAVTLLAEHHFKTASEALDNIRDITSKTCSKELIEFLTLNLPSNKKKSSKSFVLGVLDKGLAQSIKEHINVDVELGDFIIEISRIIRTHLHRFLKIESEDVLKAQLGLGHQYSRMKCMFDVNREDKPVIQSIALIDQLDKNINSFCMRIKEWFGWHFPELTKIVPDNATFVRTVSLIQNKDNLIEEAKNEDSELLKKLIDIVIEPEIAQRIIEAAKTSMGSDLSEIDAMNIKFFCEKVHGLVNYREGLGGYLKDKMKLLAPNTSTLIGDTLSARLISHAGSLSNLAKYPASTIQILGAEKALFRALKARSGKTPKYGLLYHSQFIGKAANKNKGKISRFLANKIAQSSRIDFLSDSRENIYGDEFRKQVEERMNYLNTGEKPRKNVEVMKEAVEKIKANAEEKLLAKKRKKSEDKTSKQGKKKAKKVESSDDESD
jgi:nucleolar protein 56